MTGNPGCLQRFRQLLAVYFPLFIPFLSDFVLLALAEVIQRTAQQKRYEHDRHHYKNILAYRPAFLLDSSHRHISDQIQSAPIDGPHIIQ